MTIQEMIDFLSRVPEENRNARVFAEGCCGGGCAVELKEENAEFDEEVDLEFRYP